MEQRYIISIPNACFQSLKPCDVNAFSLVKVGAKKRQAKQYALSSNTEYSSHLNFVNQFG